jgi:hypothetical protein
VEPSNQELEKELRLRFKGGAQKYWNKYLPEIIFNTQRMKNVTIDQIPDKLLFDRNLARLGEEPVVDPNHLPLRIEVKKYQAGEVPCELNKTTYGSKGRAACGRKRAIAQ